MPRLVVQCFSTNSVFSCDLLSSLLMKLNICSARALSIFRVSNTGKSETLFEST